MADILSYKDVGIFFSTKGNVMKALLRGNLSQGMKLVGIYDEEACHLIAAWLVQQFPLGTNSLDSEKHESTQFLEIEPKFVPNVYGENTPEQRCLLAQGSLTRGIKAIGPYPNKSAAMSTAVSLNFGNKTGSYYALEQDESVAELRQQINTMLASHTNLNTHSTG